MKARSADSGFCSAHQPPARVVRRRGRTDRTGRRRPATACRPPAAPAPASASSTRRRTACARVSEPPPSVRPGIVAGSSSRPWMRPTSSTRSISRVVSCSAPGRHRHGDARRIGRGLAARSRGAPRMRVSSASSIGMPRICSREAGAQHDPLALRQRGRPRPGPSGSIWAPASSTSSSAAQRRRLRREVRVDAADPAARAVGAQAERLAGAGDAVALEVRGLEHDRRASPARSPSPRRP